jgi:hypothetical protein
MALTKIKSTGIDTLAGDISLVDSAKINLGTGNDLQLYHSGSKSYIKDAGTGNLAILTSTLELNNAADSQNMVTANEGGGVYLYHAGSTKLATTSTGVTITGTAVATAFTGNVTGNASTATQAYVSNSDGNGNYRLIWTTGTTSGNSQLFNTGGVTLNASTNAVSATTFIGALTGNVTGNTSGTAATVTTAAQPAITSVGTLSSLAVGNITTTGYIRGPASFVIDPATHGDDTGTLVIAGNLQVDGTTTTINSTTVSVDDVQIILAQGASNSAAANGGGIILDGANASISYTHATTSWDFNKPIKSASYIEAVGNISTGTNAGRLRAGGSNEMQLYFTGSHGILSSSTGNFTVDVAGDIILDADGGDIKFQDAGTDIGSLIHSGNDLQIKSAISNGDMVFRGNDGGTIITAGYFDMSDAGAFHVNTDIRIKDNMAVRFGDDQDFRIYTDGSHTTLHNGVSNQDIMFKGVDDGAAITALTLDMSNAGKATFSGIVKSLVGFESGDLFITPNEIDVSSGDLTLDVAGDITLDADGGDIRFKDAGNTFGYANANNMDFVLGVGTPDKDIIFKGTDSDGAGAITALTIDMSERGKATFISGITAGTSTAGDWGLTLNTEAGDSMKLSVQDTGSSGAAHGILSVSDGGFTIDVAGDINLDSAGEIRVQNQTLVDSANTNYIMTFPNNKGIAIGSAYTYGELNANNGNLYLRANSYPANTGSTSKIYLQTANGSGGQAADVVIDNGNVGIGTTDVGAPLTIQTNDSTTGDVVNTIMIRNTSTGTTTTGFGGEIRFQAERNNGAIQNTGRIASTADVNSGTNISSGLGFWTSTVGVITEKMRISYDGKVTVSNNKPIWSGSYGGGLFLKGNNSTSDRYARICTVDSTGAAINNGLTVNNDGSTTIDCGQTYGLNILGNGSGLRFSTGSNQRLYWNTHRALEGAADGSVLQVGEGFTKILSQGREVWYADGVYHFKISKAVTCTGSSVTRHTLNINTLLGAATGGTLRYEVSIAGYGSGGSNGANAKYSVAGYSGHSYSATNYGSFGAGTIQNGYKSSNSTSYDAKGISYHPCINMGSYIANGEVWAYVPGAQQYGFTISNNSSNNFGAILTVEGIYT